ncbi:MAG: hypothetical protein QOI86_5469 [Actinomycetota bacterium]|nr:hypothetical protein [Actinomycetota bacterium]
MRRPVIRLAAVGAALLLVAPVGPHLAGAITGTGSHDTGTGGHDRKSPAKGPASAGPLVPMSVKAGGAPTPGESFAPAVSADAPGVVAFRSHADDLTADDRNGHGDVFVSDGGVLDRISVDPPGYRLTDVVAGPAISDSGDVVVYGGTLQAAATEVSSDRVVIINRRTGPTELAPPPPTGGHIGAVAVSPDGGVMTWEQDRNIYLYRVGSAAAEPLLVSRNQNGQPAGGSSHPALCDQGRDVVFASESPLVVPADTNGAADVFLSAGLLSPEAADHQLLRVSRATDGGQTDGPSTDPDISPDCGKVVFTSSATDIVPSDTNGVADVFVYHTDTATTTAVTQGDGPSGQGAISGDGSYVAFSSAADNLVADDTNGQNPSNRTPTAFQVVDRAGTVTYATLVVSVDGHRVRVGFPASADLGASSAGSVDSGALIDDQIVPVDNADGRSNTNPLATLGPIKRDKQGNVQPPGDDITDGPDLVSVQVAVDDGGTPQDKADDVDVARYCFDQPVAGIVQGGSPAGTEKVFTDRFLLEGYNSSVRVRSVRATVEHDTQNRPTGCLRTWFSTGVDISRFVGAAVLSGAVSDDRGRRNVQASKPLVGNTLAARAGDITGPNLRSANMEVIGNRVTYVFDDIHDTSSCVPDPASRFGFVDGDGRVHPGRLVAAVDAKTQTVTVEFDLQADSVVTARRFFVLPNAVRNDAGEPNVEQTTDGDVTGPELVSAARARLANASAPPAYDFTFNTDVRDVALDKFVLYTTDGTGFPAGSYTRPSPRVVRVTAPAVERFPDSIALGVAQPGAALERVRQPNGRDRSGGPNPLGVKAVAARPAVDGSVTDGPDLVSVEILPDLHAADFVFDEPVRDVHLVLGAATPDLPTDVFVRDLATGELVRASVDDNGKELRLDSSSPRISADGRYVVFVSAGLRPGAVSKLGDILGEIFRRDLLIAQVTPTAIDFGDEEVVRPGTKLRSVEVANRGFGRLVMGAAQLGGASPADFRISSDSCSGRTLMPTQTCQLALAFAPGSSGLRAGQLVVAHNALGSPRAVPLTGQPSVLGPAGQAPTLMLSPEVGPPGTVSLVRGEGFPPTVPLRLHWAPAAGGTPTRWPIATVVAVTTDASGNFGPSPLLVLPGDVLGPRSLEVDGDRPEPAAMAPFLVVPRTVQPTATPIPLSTSFGDQLRLVRRLYLLNRR